MNFQIPSRKMEIVLFLKMHNLILEELLIYGWTKIIFSFSYQDADWITIRDVHLKSPTIAVVWGGEGSLTFPSLGSAPSALHLLSSPPVPLMSPSWYSFLFIHLSACMRDLWDNVITVSIQDSTPGGRTQPGCYWLCFLRVGAVDWSVLHQISNSFEFAFYLWAQGT